MTGKAHQASKFQSRLLGDPSAQFDGLGAGFDPGAVKPNIQVDHDSYREPDIASRLSDPLGGF